MKLCVSLITSARNPSLSRPRQVRDITGVYTRARARPSTGDALSKLHSAQLAYPAPSRGARAQMRAVRALHNVSEGNAQEGEDDGRKGASPGRRCTGQHREKEKSRKLKSVLVKELIEERRSLRSHVCNKNN